MNKKIETNEDRVKLSLIEHKEVKDKTSNAIVNIGFVITFGLTLFTVDFKDYIGISSATIEAFIWILFIIFVILTIKNVIQIIYYKAKKLDSIDRFIANLKGEDFVLPKKEKKASDYEYSFFEIVVLTLRWILQILFYLLPLGLIIGLPFLASYLVKITDFDIFWFFYAIIVMASLAAYLPMFAYWSEITEWFYDLFDGDFFRY